MFFLVSPLAEDLSMFFLMLLSKSNPMVILLKILKATFEM